MFNNIFSIIFVIFAFSILAIGTYSYMFDVETSYNNTIKAGVFDNLMIKIVGDDSYYDGIPLTKVWYMLNMKPGDVSNFTGVQFKIEPGTVKASHMKIRCDYEIIDNPGPESDTEEGTSADKMAKYMEILDARYYNDWINNIDLITGCDEMTGICKDEWKIKDIDNDGRITLYDFKYSEITKLPITRCYLDGCAYIMRVKFLENAGNDFQGDVLNLTLEFTIVQ